MKKTLLLVFIHGFKGGEDTFGHNYGFTEHLRQLVAKALPKINVEVAVYPKYETRGDLGECVSRFRDWLMNKVIDLEVAAGTPSPTVDPSVRTILVGHSMGGIVAAETAIALTSEKPIHGSTDAANEKPTDVDDPTSIPRPSTPNSLMFPYIQGVLAFDTPFLGIEPGVVAHGAEGHYAAASAAISQLSGLTSLWGGVKTAEADAAKQKQAAAALPAPAPAAGGMDSRERDKGSGIDSKAADKKAGRWGRWGTVAMMAGAVGAVAAGGAAYYYNKDQIGEGWTWASSHLEFVGCLARQQELRQRVAAMVRLNGDLGVGFGNLYTRLGKGAGASPATGSLLGKSTGRTFCVVPTKVRAGDWRPALNDKANDEAGAHMTMFEPKENPGYEMLANEAKGMIASWLQNDWYASSGAQQIGN
ncbi:hypothetical protein GQ53DRAFT_715612 [Thozetella sp. PMI_491]|nr:hypothetical protein GQ53DRAFT_715612 [Thozetella sp. PMI_491]